MSTEIGRKVVGISGRGEVAIITFEDNLEAQDGRIDKKNRYVVRNGAFTIGEYASPVTANTIAKGLVAG